MELCLRTISFRPALAPSYNRNIGLIKCGIAEPSGVPAPMGQKTRYKDGFFETAFMSLFACKMEKFASGKDGAAMGWYDYESFVDVSKRVVQGRSRKEQQEVVREVLLSMLPPGAPAHVSEIIPSNEVGCGVQCCYNSAILLLVGWAF